MESRMGWKGMTMQNNDFFEYEDPFDPDEDLDESVLTDPEFEEWAEKVKHESIDPDEFPDWLSTSPYAPEDEDADERRDERVGRRRLHARRDSLVPPAVTETDDG